ncbi:uroporphyrinogen-III C-methyltransferase [Ferrimonas lipolytica]|uniref:uroporphyrinogen-III C-methyltransferase n=1 Tax=Ferrimonas lipolytica TaxID=2724191 RepID=A0A6H1UIS7_9GAMM|nr:uroporphyrinogen-III C-methyltransferase [Ferrimonas lipolytica]QIZ77702.1 uroporphyrinogen-III C-methyltransferase [Ferrimonas lipolytica]
MPHSAYLVTYPVAIVGAGPGDPELLTLKALRRIEQAEVILYDNLVSDAIRSLFPATAEALYVGKKRHNHSLSQDKIEQKMVALAQQGKKVVRLKGGDPFIFGRGSEELLTLKQHGIKAEVIPGITAASGCGSAADIPLTHRGLSQGCTFVTGHGSDEDPIDWSYLASCRHTLVFYMGLNALPQIRNQLISNGMVDTTPVALVENGCRPKQRVIRTTLAAMSTDSIRHQLQTPTLIYVGDVVSLAQTNHQSLPHTLPLLAKESA